MLPPSTTTQSKTQSKTQQSKRWFQPTWLRVLTASCLTTATLLTGLNNPILQRWERQLQTLFFELRGPQAAPEDIVILAIDDESLSQAEHARADPEKLAALAPIEQWPWQRRAYAIVIERLMQAGAKAVAVDIVLATDSGYGPEDDQALIDVLETYGDRVVLAAMSPGNEDVLRQGALQKLMWPLNAFEQTGTHIGLINFPLEMDGRIHRQGYVYLQFLKQASADLDARSQLPSDWEQITSFSEATLDAAQIDYSRDRGTHINFHGPHHTFPHIPFSYVIDPDLWQNYLQSGAVFEDQIVLIGTTADLHQDFHGAPFARTAFYPEPLAGIEVLANDIATLRSGSALVEVLPSPLARAALVFLTGSGVALLMRWSKRTLHRLAWTAGITAGTLTVSYLSFSLAGVFLPTAGVYLAILAVGGFTSLVGLVVEQIRKQRLRNTLAQYVTSPIVQEIISQEEDFQDLLEAQQAQIVGSFLGARYQVLSVLGSGGFSETYTAVDTQRPGEPTCVVKKLRIISDDPKAHHLAHRLFLSEANTLERLGHHHQIPRLLAHFETNSAFYLVEEMIQGATMKAELASRQPKSQAWVMNFLLDILPVVEFVHEQGVIHRDIKPSNIIRRSGDGRLVLIDFGSVKEISNQLTDKDVQVTSTIGIGTKGYMPSEQSAGLPRFSSDVYAVGVTAIEALTGRSPYKLAYDDCGELIWQYHIPDLSPALAHVLNQMVRYDFSQRYRSAKEVLDALREIPVTLSDAIIIDGSTLTNHQTSVDEDDQWDEPTGYLPTDWITDASEKGNTVS